MVRTPGGSVDHLVHLVDFPATIAEWFGAPAGPGVLRDSQSFAPLFADADAALARDWVFVQAFKPNGPRRRVDTKAR